MILYKIQLVEQKIFESFKCDRCKKIINRNNDPHGMELQETYSINFIGGYASVFGDEAQIACDLCQNCLKDLIKDFCRYTNIDDEDIS